MVIHVPTYGIFASNSTAFRRFRTVCSLIRRLWFSMIQETVATAILVLYATLEWLKGANGTLQPPKINITRKRKRYDSVLWQKPLHQQKCIKGKVTTQTTPQKSSIKQRLRTDLGRSVGVTKATQLVWLTGLRAHLPTNRNSRLIKRTHV